MECLIRLFQCDVPASDGSVIPRSVVQSYLMSDEYKKANANKTMLGGITHIDRFLSENDEGIGEDDRTLINRNTTHYIKDLHFGDDNFVIATLVVLDETNFDDDTKANIRYLKGLLSNGVLPPGSVVISANWDSNEVARKINSINGWDVTRNPSFEGSEVFKIKDETRR